MVKKLLLIFFFSLVFASVAAAQRQQAPEAERAMLILRQITTPASQAELVVQLKQEIVNLQKAIDAAKKQCGKRQDKNGG